MPLLPLLVSAALAQDPATDATLLYPAIDGDRAIFTEDTTIGRPGRGTARAIGTYAVDPFETGGTREDGAVLHVAGGQTIGPVRIGAAVPIVATSGVGDDDGRTGVGDVLVDGKIALARPSRNDGLGLALQGSATLPSATVEEYGREDIGWKAGAIGELRGGDWALAANAGVAGGPDYQLGNDVIEEELYGNVALSVAPARTGLGAALELVARTDLGEPFSRESASPAEGLITGWYRFDEDWALRGGVGAGLNQGVGASDGRVILGVSYAPQIEPDRTIETASR
jgi:hypothetical protein